VDSARGEVTVVIPTLNRAQLLVETLASLERQTAPCRVLVVDDGSTDDTKEVCAQFEGVEYFRNERTLGLFANWNRGLSLVETEFAAIYHDDDIYAPDIVAREVATLRKHPGVVMVHSGCHFIDDSGAVFDTFGLQWSEVTPGSSFRASLAGLISCPIATPSVMFRMDAVRAIGGFDERLRESGDLLAWFSLGAHGDIAYIPSPLVSIRRRGRFANPHAAFDWKLVDEHLAVARDTELETRKTLSTRFRLRVDWYIAQFLMREVTSPSAGDWRQVVDSHAGMPARALAWAFPALAPLRPILRRMQPAARWAISAGGRIRRRGLPTRGSTSGSPKESGSAEI
jgi:glycosyltransferase involved in cell wall biosynthesis